MSIVLILLVLFAVKVGEDARRHRRVWRAERERFEATVDRVITGGRR